MKPHKILGNYSFFSQTLKKYSDESVQILERALKKDDIETIKEFLAHPGLEKKFHAKHHCSLLYYTGSYYSQMPNAFKITLSHALKMHSSFTDFINDIKLLLRLESEDVIRCIHEAYDFNTRIRVSYKRGGFGFTIRQRNGLPTKETYTLYEHLRKYRKALSEKLESEKVKKELLYYHTKEKEKIADVRSSDQHLHKRKTRPSSA